MTFDQGTPLSAILRTVQTLTDAQVAEKCGGPALLMVALPAEQVPAPMFTTRYVSEHDGKRADLADALRGANEGGLVYFVRKRAGGAFLNQIGIGRASNVDIPVSCSGMSKYHAFFSQTDQSVWAVTDADSKNGTVVQQEQLVARQPHTLHSGDKVVFAGVQFVFHSPADFVALCRKSVKS